MPLRKSQEVKDLEEELADLTAAREHLIVVRDEALVLKRVLDAVWVEVEGKLRMARNKAR